MSFKFYSAFKLRLLDKAKYPVISLKGKELIFVHINKNAGTSILSMFNKKKFHLSVVELIQLLGPKRFDRAIKFAVVRNPYSRAISLYKHRVATNQTNLRSDNVEFNDWIVRTFGSESDDALRDKPRMFKRQIDWIKDSNGVVRVDHLLRFERLETDLKQFLSPLGVEFSLPHRNDSGSVEMPEMSPAAEELIYQYFRADFDHFGYSRNYSRGK